MFSQKDFIEVSRKFVCVRLESYESEEHQKLIRSFLNGRFENTAFCILAPDGKTRLSGTGRAPAMGLRVGGRFEDPESQNEKIIAEMERIATKYPPKGDPEEALLQDFHSFRQALNVASADQRLLLFVAAPEQQQKELREKLKPVMNAPSMIGCFHLDFEKIPEDAKWSEAVAGETAKAGLFIIRADQFGMEGEVMASLPLDASGDQIKSSLLEANRVFAEDEERKVYREHVAEGRREGIYFEGGVPYGEDRDGDGEIDHRGGLPPGEEGRRGPPRGPRGDGPPPRRGGRGGPPPGRRPPFQ